MNEMSNKLDGKLLVEKLIEKSIEGKLDWQPTAQRKQFVTSVGGNTSFRIQMVTDYEINAFGQPDTVEVPRLDMLDQKGHLLWQVEKHEVPGGGLSELFKIAQRIGNQLDDLVTGAIDALDKM